MRSLFILLTLVKNNTTRLFKESFIVDGLCYIPGLLKTEELITPEEADLLHWYIDKNRPKNEDAYNIYYSWKPRDIQARLNWLDTQLLLHSPDYFYMNVSEKEFMDSYLNDKGYEFLRNPNVFGPSTKTKES